MTRRRGSQQMRDTRAPGIGGLTWICGPPLARTSSGVGRVACPQRYRKPSMNRRKSPPFRGRGGAGGGAVDRRDAIGLS